MAKVGCLSNMDLDNKDTVMETDDGPPSKKMKQGRLPFKPLDHAGHARQSNTPPGSKKRKLSDNESPSAKQLRTGVTSNVIKTPVVDGEHEVSSSSEAEVTGDLLSKHVRKLNTIDKFFRPKPIVDQEEISSTNTVIEIDLTEDVGDRENVENSVSESTSKKCSLPDPVKIDTKACDNASKEDMKACDNASKEDATACDNESKTKATGNVDKEKEHTENDDDSGDTSQTEDKENVSDMEADSSFIASTSVCEDALKSPERGATMDSVLKTPIASSSVGNSSQGSASDSTPISGQKIRSALSESKRHAREAQRQKIKEEKEKQREEQKLQKEREKEEKKKELQEKKKQKEEQREKERLEKEKSKQEEKEKKEKDRLEKLKQKEEMKKQKEKELESKNEEKKKKEEERKQKEEERKQKEEEKKQKEEEKRKEEEEKQRKADKKKEMFKGFFIQKEPTLSPPKVKEMKNGLFMPFELKPNMKLAPSRRSPLSEEARYTVDESLEAQDCKDLYLNSVKSSTLGKSFKTWPKTQDTDDIEILSHEMETIERVTYRAKFLQFHENTRPAYYGTWRKKSKTLSARNPFKQDEELFDYEVDSDDEWEEEEPGESVSSDEEEEEGEKVEDEDPDGDDWMVPHGYLSDGEGADDDEEVDTASKQDLQKVRQAAWESELKRQAKPLRMLAIGCAWENDETTTIAAQQLQTLLKYKAVCLMDGPIPTSYSVSRSCDTESANDKTEEKTTKSSNLKKSVPEEAMPDLIRLVHGNPVGIKNLIKEFRMYWRKKTNPELDTSADLTLDSSKLDMSMEVGEKPEPSTESPKAAGLDTPKQAKANNKNDFAISKRQLEIKIPAIAIHEKRSNYKKVRCWYVKEEILEQYDMKDLQLPNTWEYVCIKPPTWAQDKPCTPKVEEICKVNVAKNGPDTPKIMKFAQPMSPSMIQALGPIIGNKDSPAADTSQVPASTLADQQTGDQSRSESPNPLKAPVPTDQRRIKDMFSPVARKCLTKLKGSPKNAAPKGQLLSGANKIVSPSSKKLTNSKTKLSEEILKPSTSSEDVPTSSTNDETTPKKGPVQTAPADAVKVTPKASTHNVLKTMLSSPELMKPNVQEENKLDNLGSVRKEQPMDVDIIVLD